MISFFKKLFRRHAPRNIDYVAEMADESERTYRGLIDIYNSDVEMGLLSAPPGASAVEPNVRGIYKARLFGSLFMAIAYAACGHSEEESGEMMNIATGVALEPLQALDQEEARSFALDHVISALKSATAAFKAGPGLPGVPTPEHITLSNHLHDALVESLGVERYTPEVRDRFDILVQANAASAMNHARRWMV